MEYKFLKFEKICQTHQEKLKQICLKSDCDLFLVPQCALCIDEHPDHPSKYIKHIEKSCEILIENIKAQKNDESQGIEEERKSLLSLAKSFKMLSEHLEQIYQKILSNLNKICPWNENQQPRQHDILTILDQIKANQNSKNSDALILFKPLENYIVFDENKKSIAIKEAQEIQQPIFEMKNYKQFLHTQYDQLSQQLNQIINNKEIERIREGQSNQIVKFSPELKHPHLQVKQNDFIVEKIDFNGSESDYNSIILSKLPLSEQENTKWKIKIINKVKDNICFGVIDKNSAINSNFKNDINSLQIYSSSFHSSDPKLKTGDLLEIEYFPKENTLKYKRNNENQTFSKDVSYKNQPLYAAFYLFQKEDSYELIQ